MKARKAVPIVQEPIDTPQPIEQSIEINPTQVNKSLPKLPLIIAALMLILCLSTGIYYLDRQALPKIITNTAENAKTPTPTPDPTANWKTFASSKNDFQIKYPPYLTAKEALTPFYFVTFEGINGNPNFDILENPDTFMANDPAAYDWLTKDMLDSFILLPLDATRQVGTIIFTKRADASVAGLSATVVETTTTDDNSDQIRLFVKYDGKIYMFVNHLTSDQASFDKFISTIKFMRGPVRNPQGNTTPTSAPTPTLIPTPTFGPTENPLSGYKFYNTTWDMYFQVPNDFVYDNKSTDSWIRFLQKEDDNLMAARLTAETIKTEDSIEAYIQRMKFDSFPNAPYTHEQTTIDGHEAIALTKTENLGCDPNMGDSVKRTQMLFIKNGGNIIEFATDDSCETMHTDWFSTIQSTIKFK